ncbi:hypothetical protein BDW59DRAFT_142436 [Aspergillus cavernicola]|uniref:Uncharacterized protein n=1 Tax=Aspergillus cavernicola TaxID=176166 RepID=A0ABR4INM7_9EURO
MDRIHIEACFSRNYSTTESSTWTIFLFSTISCKRRVFRRDSRAIYWANTEASYLSNQR